MLPYLVWCSRSYKRACHQLWTSNNIDLSFLSPPPPPYPPEWTNVERVLPNNTTLPLLEISLIFDAKYLNSRVKIKNENFVRNFAQESNSERILDAYSNTKYALFSFKFGFFLYKRPMYKVISAWESERRTCVRIRDKNTALEVYGSWATQSAVRKQLVQEELFTFNPIAHDSESIESQSTYSQRKHRDIEKIIRKRTTVDNAKRGQHQHDILRTAITCRLASSSKRHSPLFQGVARPLERELPRNLFSFLSSASGFNAGEPRRCRPEYGKPAYISGATFPSSSSSSLPSSSSQKRIDLRNKKHRRQSARVSEQTNKCVYASCM